MPMTNCFFSCIEQEDRRESEVVASIDNKRRDIEIGVFTVSVSYICHKCIDIFPKYYILCEILCQKRAKSFIIEQINADATNFLYNECFVI